MDPTQTQNIPQQPNPLQNQANTQQQVNQYAPSQSQESNFMKRVLFVLIGFLLLLAVGSGAYYLGTKNTNGKVIVEKSTVNLSPTSAIKTQPSPTENPTTNWKTYTVADFSLQYPQTFYLDQEPRGAVYIFNDQQAMKLYISGTTNYPLPLTTNQIAISLISLPENFNNNLQGLANRIAGGSQTNVAYTPVTVHGHTGVKVLWTDFAGNKMESYGFLYNTGFVWISALPSNSSFMPAFEQMINSLQIK